MCERVLYCVYVVLCSCGACVSVCTIVCTVCHFVQLWRFTVASNTNKNLTLQLDIVELLPYWTTDRSDCRNMKFFVLLTGCTTDHVGQLTCWTIATPDY